MKFLPEFWSHVPLTQEKKLVMDSWACCQQAHGAMASALKLRMAFSPMYRETAGVWDGNPILDRQDHERVAAQGVWGVLSKTSCITPIQMHQLADYPLATFKIRVSTLILKVASLLASKPQSPKSTELCKMAGVFLQFSCCNLPIALAQFRCTSDSISSTAPPRPHGMCARLGGSRLTASVDASVAAESEVTRSPNHHAPMVRCGLPPP